MSVLRNPHDELSGLKCDVCDTWVAITAPLLLPTAIDLRRKAESMYGWSIVRDNRGDYGYLDLCERCTTRILKSKPRTLPRMK